MAGSGLGQSEFSVRTSAGVERTGTATDRNYKHNPRQERRDRQPPNPQRRRIYDLLFDEIDQFDTLNDHQRDRLKANLREHLTANAPPPAAQPPPPDQDEEALADKLLKDPAAKVPVDEDRIVKAATAPLPGFTPEQVAGNAILAIQLRDCLARHTDRARKVAVYLHLLLTIDGALRPHTIVDV
ncbi:hypothetical protein [Azospirillum sp.]|uniref:hypothetical protein n=1 Tax=Azospirillum sp. TaxID=34012 RepID=UPI00261876B0|nr:hypothetical protein [Azospirillum sp.]